MKNEKSQKTKSGKGLPKDFHSITPFIVVKGAEKFIDFLAKSFDAKQTFMMKNENGSVSHATVKIGDSCVMISDAMENFPPFPALLYLYVPDTDAFYKRAIENKATSLREPLDEFWGDRSGGVRDEWGNQWWIATHLEDVSDDELARRKKEFDLQHA